MLWPPLHWHGYDGGTTKEKAKAKARASERESKVECVFIPRPWRGTKNIINKYDTRM